MLGAAGKERCEVGGIGSAERVSQALGGGLVWREVERIWFPEEKKVLISKEAGRLWNKLATDFASASLALIDGKAWFLEFGHFT